MTWHCNFDCPYCWQRQGEEEFKPVPFIHADKWIEALNRLNIETLDISGGEPFMQPGFLRILTETTCRIGMTSNLSFDLLKFVQTVSPSKVFTITASYHPTQKLDLQTFTGKIALLMSKGFNVTVNFVGYPEQMYLTPMMKGYFEGLGFKFHVDPYVPYSKPYEFSNEEKAFLKNFVGEDREHYLKDGEQTMKMCSGGRTHLHIQPNGDAYRCFLDRKDHKPMIGNIFNPDFKLQSDTPCNVWSKCLGCDRDKVTLHD